MRFIAIDFETASNQADSACQIGLVVVEDGEIIAEHESLIRPPRLYFSPQCIAVHGIRPADVKDAPSWDAVWEEYAELFEAFPIIAHNAGFDLNVLTSCMATYGIACPYLEYNCTRLVGRRAWPGRASYALKSLADNLQLTFQHHNALEDSRICAKILLAAAAAHEAEHLKDLEQRLSIDRGRVQFGVRIPPKGRTIRKSKQPSRLAKFSSDSSAVRETLTTFEPLDTGAAVASMIAQSIVQQSGSAQPLAGKYVVLSGRLLGLDRGTAIGFLQQLGGAVQNDINLQTSLVITGVPENETTSLVLSERQSAEIELRNTQGQTIRVLSQRQLLSLIPGAAAIARANIGV